MPPDKSSNAPALGPTSRNGPTTHESESAFLTRQTAEAKLAIQRVMGELAGDLTTTVDPRAWIKVAPWTTLAGAALAGFAATAAMVPSRQQQTLRRLRKIEESLREDREERADHPAPRRSSFLTMLIGQSLKSLQPVVMSAISAALATKASQNEPATGGVQATGNGHDTPAAAADREMPDI